MQHLFTFCIYNNIYTISGYFIHLKKCIFFSIYRIKISNKPLNKQYMKSRFLNLAVAIFLILTGCSKYSGEMSLSDSMPSGSSNGNEGSQNQPGVITAGEWNDLDNWSFWQDIIKNGDFKALPWYWSFFNNNRISVEVTDVNSQPAADILVSLKRNGTTIFNAKTDNTGKAELWVDLFQYSADIDCTTLTIDIENGVNTISEVKSYKDGVNKIEISPLVTGNKIEISFVVDATGSMGDELEYLKTELVDVISKVKSANPNSSVLTSAVFYRDEGDDYVTKVSPFTNDENTTINFIKKQSANGGGDFPEAVHSALDKAINELQWSASAKTRLLFLLLDAPPHHRKNVISDIQSSIVKATEKGIKIIPITASGINKETEFLMRFMAITTNGTYVFITDHSGIGNSHLEPSVGEYQVEFLNDLMVRLINKYAE